MSGNGETIVYSVAEVAQLLGCGEDKIQALIRQRKIPYVDLGPKTRIIPREALKAWLLSEAQQSISPAPS